MTGLTIDDGTARAAFGRFMFLVGYGTADEVWNEAAALYNAFKNSYSAGALLPSYSLMMDAWATRNSAEAQKNLTYYGQRYPTP